MREYSFNRKEEQEGRIKSGIITAIIWLAILLFVFTYSVTISSHKDNAEVSTMLINFGDLRNGQGLEEPADQEGSLAAITTEANQKENLPTPTPEKTTNTEIKTEKKTEKVAEKSITGKNEKISRKKSEKTDKTVAADKNSLKNSTANTSKIAGNTKATQANAKTGTGDGLGNAAIGNLIKGKGSKPGSQGTGTGIGNAGDPLGGAGDGDSRIGVDRKLIAFIPGTMGRGGAQPANKCTGSGTITIAYVVDKAGHVTSASRQSGSSDPCLVSTSETWVKKYVKAEKASTSSKGTYKITF